jgi:hypothetical protein
MTPTRSRLSGNCESAAISIFGKRESKKEIARRFDSHLPFHLKKEELARAIGSCKFESFVYKVGTQERFGDTWYDQLFCHDVDYYLACYWLEKRVRLMARGQMVGGKAKCSLFTCYGGESAQCAEEHEFPSSL